MTITATSSNLMDQVVRQNRKRLRRFVPALHHIAYSTTSNKSCEPPTLPVPTTLSPRLPTQPTTLNSLPAPTTVDITGSVPPIITAVAEPPTSFCNSPPQAPPITVKHPIDHSTSPDSSHQGITLPSQLQHEAAIELPSHLTHSKRCIKTYGPETGQWI